MTKTGGPTRAQRSEEVRGKWAAHVAAWRACGGRQSDYCRERGLDPKYFSIWKGRLGARAAAGEPARLAPTLVPIVVTAAPRDLALDARTNRDAEFSVGVTLPNGIALNIRLPSVRALPPLVAELSRLSC